MTRAVLPSLVRPLVEGRLPPWLDPRWFASREEAVALAVEAEIGWFDMNDKAAMADAVARASRLRWLNSIYAGLDGLPLDLLIARGVAVTNGAGINALTIAEYVVMGMLTVAKGYDDVVRARDRREWLHDSPGKVELAGSRALILGGGAIGALVAARLAAFDVAVETVRRRPDAGQLGPDDWRARLPLVDWLVLAVPATRETEHMVGAAEFAALKPGAVLVNVARGSVVDQDALVAALRSRHLGAAFLDVTTPEPLPADHPLWTLPNAHLTMHLSGRAQDKMIVRSADRFLVNLDRWERGETLLHRADLAAGY